MDIKILGSGCAKCERLENNVRQALIQLKKEASIEKVTDLGDIASYGVMQTPALVVDGTVILSGRVLSAKKLQNVLKGE